MMPKANNDHDKINWCFEVDTKECIWSISDMYLGSRFKSIIITEMIFNDNICVFYKINFA